MNKIRTAPCRRSAFRLIVPMSTRRDFLKTGAAAAAASIAIPRLLSASDNGAPALIQSSYLAAPASEAYAIDFAADALNAAKDAGASYCDVRIGRYRRQSVSTRERQLTKVSDSESYGIGIRTLVNGSWGFASTINMTKEGVVKAAREGFQFFEFV